ncbi:hypothetical protein DVQ58_20780 [Yersinia enterocolitica]|nr:hypothetical protein [Yersinia enterocolitica]
MKQSGCLACSLTTLNAYQIVVGWYLALIILTSGYTASHQPARTAPRIGRLKLSMQNASAENGERLILMVVRITAAAHHDAAHRSNN